MVTLSIQTNFKDILGRLDELQKDVATKAMASALNKTTELGKTEMIRGITGEFNVKAGYVRQRLRVKRATFNQGRYGLSAELIGGDGKKRSANIIAFIEGSVTLAEGRRRAKAGTRNQLFAKIKRTGGKKALGSAFIGNKGRTVFMRTGTGRLPIKPMNTIDIPQMFNTKRVNAKVQAYMLKRFPEVFEREAAFYVRKFNS